MTFSQAKAIGDAGAVVLWRWFSTMGLFAESATGNWPGWDMAIRGLVEVKTDNQAERTKNLFLETHTHGTESGFSVSKATCWIYLVGRRAYFISSNVLREIMSRLPEITNREGKTGRLLALAELAKVPHVEADVSGVMP